MAPNNTTPEEQQRDRSGDRAAGAGPLIGGTVFVGVITACALVLSYHGLFQLAEYGGHEGSAFAHVFPVTYALLVLMAFWVSYVLRSAPPRDRLWVDVGLIPVLILFAGATMAARNLGLFDPQVEGPLLSERVANVIVAVAPLAALLVAILLWITVRAHMRRRNRSAAARPKPSADRTTVLPARRPATDEPEPAPLKTRLFDLGQEPRVEDEADSTETERLPTVSADPVEEDEGHAEPDPVADTHAFARPEQQEEPDAVRSRAEAGAPEEPEPEPEPVEASPEPAPVLGSLPRRRGGDNPIKHAAEQPPVVPGAAPPREPEPGPAADSAQEDLAFHPVVVPDHLADEGFEHQSPVGDPITDEAEAPRDQAPYAGAEPAGPTAENSPEPVPDREPARARAEATLPVRAATTSAGTPETPVHATVSFGTDPGADTAPAEAPSEAAPVRSGASAASGTPLPGGADAERGWDATGVAPVEPESGAETSEHGPDGPSTAASGHTPSGPPSAPEEIPVAAGGLDDEEDGTAAPRTPEPAAYEPPDDTSDGPALWEPPAEETGGILDDYVPPVWTPPEDDGPFPGAAVGEPEGRAATGGSVPALDHDTGPEVRAAFGRPAAGQPGAPLPEEPGLADEHTDATHGSDTGSGHAARPDPEHTPAATEHARSEPVGTETAPEPEEAATAPRHAEPACEPAQAEEPAETDAAPEPASDTPSEEPVGRGNALRRTAPPPRETPPPLRRTPPPPAKPRSAPKPQGDQEHDPRALRKRPMVLKPRRPPIPDLNSGPPSRQVRSEPMRPED